MVPDASAEHLRDAPAVVAREGGEVHAGVEVAAGEDLAQPGRGAVGAEPLHPVAEGIRLQPPRQQGDPVAAGQEPPRQEGPDEAGAADDEDAHDRSF